MRQTGTPSPAADEVLVRVAAVGICGSDVQRAQHAEGWEPWGHEYCGVVERVGESVTRCEPGDTVVWVPVLPCGRCRRCLSGRTLMCVTMRGDPCRGAAEFVCHSEDFWLRYDGLTETQAALAEPLTVAIDLVDEASVRLGDTALVIGAGPIGLMAGRLCQLRGAQRVAVAELSACQARIGLARSWGFEVIESDRQELAPAVRELAPDGADAVLVTAPPAVLPTAIQCCAFGATVALIGTAYGGAECVTLDVNDFHFRNIRIQGANNCPVLRFPLAFDLMRSSAIDVEALVTHEFPLEEVQRAFQAASAETVDVVKVVVTA